MSNAISKRHRWILVIALLAFGARTDGQVPDQQSTTAGTLNIIWEDRPDDQPPLVSAIVTTDDGTRIRIAADDLLLVMVSRGELRSGQRVIVPTPSVVAALSADLTVGAPLQSVDATISAALITPVYAGRPQLGSQKWATILCRYSDALPSAPVETSYYQQLMGDQPGGLAAYWKEASYGYLEIEGRTVVGWVNLPQASQFYQGASSPPFPAFKFEEFSADCISAARSQLTLAEFSGFVLVSSAGSFGGASGLGGGTSILVNGTAQRFGVALLTLRPHAVTVAHEMGHTFGLHHSSEGGREGYSDWDIMSGAGPGPGGEVAHPIAHHKGGLAWIPEGLVKDVSSGNSTFELDILAAPRPETLLSARVPLSDGTYYSVEARRRTGSDVALPADGVLIHHVAGGRFAAADLISRLGGGGAGAAWLPGDVFRDPARGVSIRVNRATEHGYSVTVSHGPLGKPFGTIDTPSPGASLAGEVAVTGWALSTLGITSVRVYRSPMAGEPTQTNGYVFIGEADLVAGSRPDVAALYPDYPNSDRAGWGLMVLSNMLPRALASGFTLVAYATDAAGQETLLGSVPALLENDRSRLPFGTIDTPGQGEIVRGTIVNFGWALTPPPNIIRSDGIGVYVDGVFVGRPTYGSTRLDVDALFTGYANTGGSGGHFFLDTTTLDNGVHTIAWSVVDSSGNAQGIGSRFFTVDNPRAVIYSNRTDERALSVVTKNSTYDFYGPKDDNGLPQGGSWIAINGLQGESRIEMASGVVKSAHSTDGYSFGFSQGQITTVVGPSGNTYTLPAVTSGNLEVLSSLSLLPKFPLGIQVMRCGQPVTDPIPLMVSIFAPVIGHRLGQFYASKEPGESNRYVAHLPVVDPFAYENVKTSCNAIVGKIWDDACAINRLPDDVAQQTIVSTCSVLAKNLKNPAAGIACVGVLEASLLACNLLQGDNVCSVGSAVISPFLNTGYVARVLAGRDSKLFAERTISDTTKGLDDVLVDIGSDAVCTGTYTGTGSITVETTWDLGPMYAPENRILRRTYIYDSLEVIQSDATTGAFKSRVTLIQHPHYILPQGFQAVGSGTIGFRFVGSEVVIQTFPPLTGTRHGGVIELSSPGGSEAKTSGAVEVAKPSTDRVYLVLKK